MRIDDPASLSAFLLFGFLLAPSPAAAQGPVCGDNSCEPGVEDCGSCLADCPCWGGTHCSQNQCVPNTGPCGDGVCAAGVEDCSTCLSDCACELGLSCSNGQCVAGPAGCGNEVPEPGENCESCPDDVAFRPVARVSVPNPAAGQEILFTSDPSLLLLPQEPPARWDLGNGEHRFATPIDLAYAYPSEGAFDARISAIERNCSTARTSEPVRVAVGADGGGGECSPPSPCHDDGASAVSGGSTLIDVSWSGRPAATGYKVWRRDRPEDPWQARATLGADRFSYRDDVESMPGPAGQDSYEYRVHPLGTGPQSPPIDAAKIFGALPSAPRLIGPKQCISTTRPAFGWGPGLRAELWQLEVSDAATGEILFDEVLDELRWTLDQELEAEVPYRFRVRGFNNVPEDDGAGPWSESMYFMPGCASIAAPFPLEPRGCVATRRPTLSWSTVPGALSYKVKVSRAADGGLVYYEDVFAPASSFTPPADLGAGVEYWFQVKATNGAVDGPWSRMRYFTPLCVPSSPPGVAAPVSPWLGELPSPRPVFVWETGRDASHHRLTVRTYPQSTLVLDRSYSIAESCSGIDCTVTPELVLPAGEYFWEVRASNVWGTAPPGPQARFGVPHFPTLSIGSAAVAEGDEGLVELTFALTLSEPASRTVRARWSTRPDSARAGLDFVADEGEITISEGSGSAAIDVRVLGDRIHEGDESLFVDLVEVTGAIAPDPRASGTIVDQDPKPRVSVRDAGIVEGEAPESAKLQFELVLEGETERPASVGLALVGCTATAGSDFGPLGAERADFAPGATRALVEIEIPGDDTFEADELLFLRLADGRDATILDGEALGAIQNDDPPIWGGPSPLPPPADFDGDGSADWVLRNEHSGALVAWSMRGVFRIAGTFFEPSAPADAGWRPVAVADFDADGDADLLFRNTDSGRLVFWYLDATLRVGAALLEGPADPELRLVAASDFDLDDRADLLWQNDLSGELLVWSLDGKGSYQELSPQPSNSGDPLLRVVAQGDLDADGWPDLVLRHAVSGALVGWRMDGLRQVEILSFSPAALPDPNWQLVAAADFDRSGSLDFVWQHASSSRLVAWLMAGTTRVCGTFTVPDAPAQPSWKVVGPR